MPSRLHGPCDQPMRCYYYEKNSKYNKSSEEEEASELQAEVEELCNNIPERDFEELTIEKYQSIIKSEDDRQIIRKILDDYEFAKYCTARVSTTITVEQMATLMNSYKQRSSDKVIQNYINFLFKREITKIATKRIRHRKSEPHRQWLATIKEYPIGTLFDPETFEPIYRKWHNSIIMRIKPIDLNSPRNWAKHTSTNFAPDLVIDMSYTTYMDERERNLTLDQLSMLYGANQEAFEPYNLYFCSYNPDPVFHRRMELKFPNVMRADSFITLESRSYLDLFPKEKLIYLSPDAYKPLLELKDTDVCIIGGLVDKTFRKPLTKAKAKMEGIRMARLPIDEFVIWSKSTKSLTLNQVVTILCKFRETGDWREALLAGIPKRKLKSPEQIQLEEEAKKKKYLQRRRVYTHFLNEEDMKKSI